MFDKKLKFDLVGTRLALSCVNDDGSVQFLTCVDLGYIIDKKVEDALKRHRKEQIHWFDDKAEIYSKERYEG